MFQKKLIMNEPTQKPYTIKLFMPDGNPKTFKIINKMNWTGEWDLEENRKNEVLIKNKTRKHEFLQRQPGIR